MKKNSKILIIGHNSLTGNALLRRLAKDGFKRIITVKSEPDLIDQRDMQLFFKKNRPEYIFFMDVKSGGIIANSAYPADFIYSNLQAQNNIIHCAWQVKARKLLFVASSCVYPKNCPQPMKEEYLLTGSLEPTSEAFAAAKIMGIKMCQYYNRQYGTDFISVIPATVFGQNDNFNLKMSHVIPALIYKFHEAKKKGKPVVTIWGTGRPRREFLYVEDMVDACIFMMKNFNIPEIVNIGTGTEISIRKLAELIRKIVNFDGKLKFDVSKPDGALRKLLDSARLKTLGFEAETSLPSGIEKTYNWYLRSSHGGA